jgi:hypothetical protein
MIQRTYVVTMPSDAGVGTALDVVVQGPVGTPNAPVAGAGYGLTKTAPPAGWTGEPDGSFYEWRSRTMRFETEFGDTGFVPRTNLGVGVSITPLVTGGDVPGFFFARSFALAASVGFSVVDQTYGPVLRLVNSANVQGRSFLVVLTLPEAQDEDSAPSGAAG